MAEFVTVAKTSDIEPGKMILVEVDDEDVAVANVNGEYYAFGAECPHAGGPLDEGRRRGKHCGLPVAWGGVRHDYRKGAYHACLG